jgi:hypothetical protein
VTVRIDQSDGDGDGDRGDGMGAADSPGVVEARDAGSGPAAAGARPDLVARTVEYRATVDATYRAHAIDRAYEKICEIERGTVTPAMRRIEAEDPDRRLAGLEHRLKGKDRLTEKVTKMVNELGHSVDGALSLVKDAIRYTFCYSEDRYASGVSADWERMERAGFQPVERENSWENEQYKGINSRWRVPENGQLFEVQFHTQASLDAKEETHWAYEKLRVGAPTRAEQRELEGFQIQITARVPTPPSATDIPDYP